MFYETFREMWDETHEDRDEMLALYDTLEYLPRLLTKAEIILVRDLIEVSEPTKTFAEFCTALKMTADEIADVFDIPAEVIIHWEVNGIPEYMRKMIACSVVSALIEDYRCHTCQGCGEFFFSQNPGEVMCEGCRRDIGEWLLSHYVSFKLLNSEAEAEAEVDETESEAES